MKFVLDLEYLLTIKLYMAHIGLVAQYIYIYINIAATAMCVMFRLGRLGDATATQTRKT